MTAGLDALKVRPPSDTSELGADGMAQRALRSPGSSNRRDFSAVRVFTDEVAAGAADAVRLARSPVDQNSGHSAEPHEHVDY